jgi:Fe-S-cluster containining protein
LFKEGKFLSSENNLWHVMIKEGMRMHVNVFLTNFQDTAGYDLEVLNPAATVQDYLDSLNSFQDKFIAPCRGCDNCCWERIPLTYLDVVNYINDPNIRDLLSHGIPPLTAFIHRFCFVFGQGQVVDIFLRQQDNSACVFLNIDRQICSCHASRSLVCQTFVCLPHSQRGEELRNIIVNTGEDELVRQYLLEAEALGEPIKFNESQNASPRLADYPPTVFSGKTSYREVRIKDIVPESLWNKLYHPNKQGS